MARGHHSLAIGCSDGYVRVIQIARSQKVKNPASQRHCGGGSERGKGSEWSLVFESNVHQSSVWKIKWSLTGNVLLSAGDDAKIYLWRRCGRERFEAVGISDGDERMGQEVRNALN